MTTPPPVLTAAAVATAAGRKARKIQRKLTAAEAELQASNKLLGRPVTGPRSEEVKDALEHNAAAEIKVHEAAQELEVVAELLSDVKDALPGAQDLAQQSGGRSGEGANSAIQHLHNRPT